MPLGQREDITRITKDERDKMLRSLYDDLMKKSDKLKAVETIPSVPPAVKQQMLQDVSETRDELLRQMEYKETLEDPENEIMPGAKFYDESTPSKESTSMDLGGLEITAKAPRPKPTAQPKPMEPLDAAGREPYYSQYGHEANEALIESMSRGASKVGKFLDYEAGSLWPEYLNRLKEARARRMTVEEAEKGREFAASESSKGHEHEMKKKLLDWLLRERVRNPIFKDVDIEGKPIIHVWDTDKELWKNTNVQSWKTKPRPIVQRGGSSREPSAMDPYGLHTGKVGQGEFDAAKLATIMAESEDQIQQLVSSGYDPSDFLNALSRTSGDYGAVDAVKREYLAKDPRSLEYFNSLQRWLDAKTRVESGAAIHPWEYERNDNQFFAKPNDPDTVMKNKAAARNNILESISYGGTRVLANDYMRMHGKPVDPLSQSPGKLAKEVASGRRGIYSKAAEEQYRQNAPTINVPGKRSFRVIQSPTETQKQAIEKLQKFPGSKSWDGLYEQLKKEGVIE